MRRTLARKLRTLFPDEAARAEVVGLLNRYGSETYEREADRVRLDILKLAGPAMEAVKTWVKIAKTDYRDVLASAEYPNQMRSPTWKLPEADRLQIEAVDRRQYDDWLKK